MIEEFQAADTKIFGISPDDDADRVAKMVAELKLTFAVLHDAGLEVSKAYGIVNQGNGKMPHPTVVVVDEAGIIRWFHLDEDYTRRPTPQTVLEAVRGGGEKAAG